MKRIRLPLADDMPFDRMRAYVVSWAISQGHRKFSWCTVDGAVYLKIPKEGEKK